MTRRIFAFLIGFFISLQTASAQDGLAWVQVEAQPSLNQAQTRIRTYAARLPDVNGFALGGGWYGIALGPYTRDDAQRVLNVYRAERQIPRDSFITFSSAFRQQFWPVGANLLNLPAPATPTTPGTEIASATPEPEPQVQAQPEPEPQVRAADETPAEARRSEALLDREARKELQVMLQWAGFYNAAIDGAFGRGTRGSMARWQEANNYEPTGILTTGQRAELKKQYNAVLDGLDLQLVRDEKSGIEMQVPLGVVEFARYSPPFAQFDGGDDNAAKVLFISQSGDQNTLYGLYDIMQTLEIVPEEGPRERTGNGFTLTGQNDRIVSFTEAKLVNGEVKGFTLVWPAGDEERRTRLLGEMQKSFARIDGVLDPAAGDPEEQNIDLVAGLEIRRPKLSRSGFYVDDRGTVVTTAEAVAQCEKITLDGDHEAEVLVVDAARGIAVLRSREALAPMAVASLSTVAPRLQSEVAVSGFSYEGVLGAPTLTFGRLSDVKGLRGEPEVKRLALNALPGDAGGPVFDSGGAVMGMLLPDAGGSRKLPEDVSFAMDAEAIRAVLGKAGVSIAAGQPGAAMAPEDLTDRARDTTALVSCW